MSGTFTPLNNLGLVHVEDEAGIANLRLQREDGKPLAQICTLQRLRAYTSVFSYYIVQIKLGFKLSF